MRYINLVEVRNIIEKNSKNLVSASIGLHEDWFRSRRQIWERGKKYLINLNATTEEVLDIVNEFHVNVMVLKTIHTFVEDLLPYESERRDFFNRQICEMESGCPIASTWATPTLQLIFEDGTDIMIECSIGEAECEMPSYFKLDDMAAELQKTVTPLFE